jgi:hypothetical protein
MIPAESFERRGLNRPAPEQDVWIGAHGRGETPLDYPPDLDSW